MTDNTITQTLHLFVGKNPTSYDVKCSSDYYIKSGEFVFDDFDSKYIIDTLEACEILRKIRKLPQTPDKLSNIEIKAFEEFYMREIREHTFSEIHIREGNSSEDGEYTKMKTPLPEDDIVLVKDKVMYTFRISIFARHPRIREIFKVISFDSRRLSLNNQVMMGILVSQLSKVLNKLILRCEVKSLDTEIQN